MKRYISVIMCFVMVLVMFAFSASAEGGAKLTVSDVSGVPSDTIIVSVSIENDPGIAQIGFSLKYNKSVLEYKGYYKGILQDYAVCDNAKKAMLGFASIGEQDITENGDLVMFEFAVKENSKSGDYKISLSDVYAENSQGANLKFETENGILKVSDACEGEHTYGDWIVKSKVSCSSYGIKYRLCKTCGHTEIEKTEPSEHDFEENFTLDVVAENGNNGMLSRHCRVCGAKTKIIVYSENSTAALNINNVLSELDSDSLDNLIFFLNGFKSYPDVIEGEIDEKQFAQGVSAFIEKDKTVNVGAAVDKILRRFFGNNKKSGIFGLVKRAAISGQIPLKFIGKLIASLFF